MCDCYAWFEKLRSLSYPASIRNRNVHVTYNKRFIAEKRPVKIVITGAGNAVSYALLPMIANGGMFGAEQPVILHGIDVNVDNVQQNMKGIRMELEDGCYPLLRGILFTTDPEAAFRDADYAILMPVDSGVDAVRTQVLDAGQVLDVNVDSFTFFGQQIENFASRRCKVVVLGPNANTHCLVTTYAAPSIPFQNFTACANVERNRAEREIARRSDAQLHEVRTMIIWGCVGSRDLFADATTLCTVRGHPVLSSLDENWLKTDLQRLLRMRHKRVLGSRQSEALALTYARAVSKHMHDWVLGTREGDITSMCVITKESRLSSSNGSARNSIVVDSVSAQSAPSTQSASKRFYGVAEGLCFSFPVRCKNGEWEIVQGLRLNDFVEKQIRYMEELLKTERELASNRIRSRK